MELECLFKETYYCNSNLKENTSAKMVVPKVTILFEVTGCKFVIKMADLVAADSYEVYILIC